LPLVLLSAPLHTFTASLPNQRKAEVAAAHPVVAAAAQRIMPLKRIAAHRNTDIGVVSSKLTSKSRNA
jgi:hypothetical protein